MILLTIDAKTDADTVDDAALHAIIDEVTAVFSVGTEAEAHDP